MDTLYIHALRFARVRFARTAGILLLAVGFAAKAGAFWKRRAVEFIDDNGGGPGVRLKKAKREIRKK